MVNQSLLTGDYTTKTTFLPQQNGSKTSSKISNQAFFLSRERNLETKSLRIQAPLWWWNVHWFRPTEEAISTTVRCRSSSKRSTTALVFRLLRNFEILILIFHHFPTFNKTFLPFVYAGFGKNLGSELHPQACSEGFTSSSIKNCDCNSVAEPNVNESTLFE